VTHKEQLGILEEWLMLHKGLIFKVIQSYTLADHDDLFQEIIIQVWHSIPSFRQEASVTTWLYRIALNTAIKWTKKEKKHASAGALDSLQHLLQENKTAIDERLGWLYGEIYKLDEIDRSVALLLLEGYSYKEMSTILGISESNVGVKINRIKKQLIAKSKKYDNHGVQ
jgi:RNA polymerase sigma-70 factor (ECF subfamily)